MARNKNKYLYLELAILRDSPLFHALLEDAAASGKPAALVAAQRLADYYRAIDRPGAGRLSPTIPALPATSPVPSASPVEASSRTSSRKELLAPVLAENDEESLEYRAAQARTNALAALRALDTWEHS